MTKMSQELEAARDEAFAMAESKLGTTPEWRLFARMDRLWRGSILPMPSDIRELVGDNAPRRRRRSAKKKARPPSYVELGIKALEAAGVPLRTPDMLEYVGNHRGMSPSEVAKSRITIQSSFSKDPRLISIPWGGGGKAWWLADRDPPQGIALVASR